jgi:hypothetical protein
LIVVDQAYPRVENEPGRDTGLIELEGGIATEKDLCVS